MDGEVTRMRLIDADRIPFNKVMQNPFDEQSEMVEVIEKRRIEQMPTIQAIPLDKVKQAREEIEELATEQIPVYDEENPYISCVIEYVSLTEVRELLDKLIAESEGVND